MKTDRLYFLDELKGIGIMLVVLGHLTNRLILDDFRLAVYINSFHLPLFFIVGGYLFALKNDYMKGSKEYIRNKAYNLLYPYLTFSLLYMVYYIISLLITDGVVTFKQMATLGYRIISCWGIGTLWFLPTLFFAQIGIFSLMKIKNRYIRFGLILIVACIGCALGYVMNAVLAEDGQGIRSVIYRITCTIARIMIGMLFVYIGIIVQKAEQWITCKGKHLSKIPCLIISLTVLSVNIFIAQLQPEINLRVADVKNIALYILTGTMVTVAIAVIMKQIGECKWLGWLGCNSLIIMATHEPFNLIGYISGFICGKDHYNSYLFLFAAFIAVMMAEAAIIVLINRFAPFIVKRRLSVERNCNHSGKL